MTWRGWSRTIRRVESGWPRRSAIASFKRRSRIEGAVRDASNNLIHWTMMILELWYRECLENGAPSP